MSKLGALGEPKSLTWLRGQVEKMFPKIDLPELLFEVHGWTGFLDAFVHLGDGTTRMKDLTTSLVALLVSEACNIGMTPVINPAHEALTRARLVHVDQFYLRADTIATANAALITAQGQVPIVRYWGDGLLASVDGLRFVVPVRTINAALSPKYFGFKRRITWLNAVNDQVAGIGQMVVPGTPRDSLHILDALLNLDGGVKPEMPPPTTPRTPTSSSASSRSWATTSAPGSRTWTTSGSGARRSPASRPARTGRWSRWPATGSTEQGDHALAGHATGRRFPGHQPGPRLRPAADVRPRRTPHALETGIRRVRAHRQDRAPARVVDPVDDTYRRQMNR